MESLIVKIYFLFLKMKIFIITQRSLKLIFFLFFFIFNNYFTDIIIIIITMNNKNKNTIKYSTNYVDWYYH